METEMETEMEKRIKQYEFYRNKLFHFDGKDVEKCKLSNVVKINGFKQVSAEELQKLIVDNGDIPLLPSSQNYN